MSTTVTNEDESKKARASIAQFYLLLSRRNHFELLGVNRESDADAIRTAFKALARRWHVDSFANLDLGPERDKLDEIFQRLNEAHETLIDPPRREEYLVLLDRSAKGMATDVHGILRAEAMVDEALLDMRRRQWDSAQQKLLEARELNPDDPLYDVHYAWVQYHLARGDETGIKAAVGLLKGATKRQSNLPQAYQHLGQIYFNQKNYPEAKKWWRICLQYEPRNVDVQRGVRLINTRAQKQQNGLTAVLEKITEAFKKLIAMINKLLGKK